MSAAIASTPAKSSRPNKENHMPPFDPDFDADNPFITEVPERFVVDPEPMEADWAFQAEAIFDPDLIGA